MLRHGSRGEEQYKRGAGAGTRGATGGNSGGVGKGKRMEDGKGGEREELKDSHPELKALVESFDHAAIVFFSDKASPPAPDDLPSPLDQGESSDMVLEEKSNTKEEQEVAQGVEGTVEEPKDTLLIQAKKKTKKIGSTDGDTRKAFYNALVDLLWRFGQKQGARRVILEAQKRQVFGDGGLKVNVQIACLQESQTKLNVDKIEEAKGSALADDLTVACINKKDSLEKLKSVLDKFCELSEASINWDKSVFFLHQQFTSDVDWGLRQIPADKVDRFLRVQVTLTNCSSTQDNIMLEKVVARINGWVHNHQLSLFGRVLVLSTAAFSILWFRMTIHWLGDEAYKIIRRVAAKYLWKPTATEQQSFIVKAAWEIVCCARDQGGLGILDPRDQNIALLVKWPVAALVGGEDKDWLRLAEVILMKEWSLKEGSHVWLCFLIGSYCQRRLKSPLWRNILHAWNKVRPQLLEEPKSKGKILNQLLFENRFIRCNGLDQLMADSNPGSFGRSWIEHGLIQLKDIVDEEKEDWFPLPEIKRRIPRHRLVQQNYEELKQAIPAHWTRVLSLAKDSDLNAGCWVEDPGNQDRGPHHTTLESRKYSRAVRIFREAGFREKMALRHIAH
ncbi:hypothetical protein CBR_g60687 [Chara braunii]|uniref:Uncharacterized protein n=1 Tax=Chara braunii TaxID=69332 RepID=A0A388MFB8_CHABU|nr:hypothetical protein CBR_g60687 [Chara braunii]|eukprot:GBG93213.1 hypothetical protein CBR_g60687 [Chara braunii]